MPARTFVVGATCAIDKSSARAESGQWAAVAAVDAATTKGTILIVPNQDDARLLGANAAAALLGAASGGGTAAPDASAVSEAMGRVVRTLTEVTPASIQNGSLTSAHAALFGPPAPGGADARPEGIDLVGTTVAVRNVPILRDGAVAGLYSGDVQVQFVAEGGFHIKFTSATLGECELDIAVALLRAAIVPADPDGPLIPVVAGDGPVVARIKALPRSSKIDEPKNLDLVEVLTVVSAAGIAHSLTKEMVGAAAVAPALVQQLNGMMHGEKADSRTWTTLDARRLGESIKNFDAHIQSADARQDAPPPPPLFPRVEALKSVLQNVGTEWDDFLQSTVELSCEGRAGHKAVALGDAHTATGALEAFLKGAKDAASPAAIRALGGGRSIGELKLFLFSLGSAPAPADDGAHRDGEWRQPLVVYPPDLSGDEETARSRAALRHDAKQVAASRADRAQLTKMVSLAAGERDELFEAIDDDDTGEHLHRLVTTDCEIEKSLAGSGTQHAPSYARALRAPRATPYARTCDGLLHARSSRVALRRERPPRARAHARHRAATARPHGCAPIHRGRRDEPHTRGLVGASLKAASLKAGVTLLTPRATASRQYCRADGCGPTGIRPADATVVLTAALPRVDSARH